MIARAAPASAQWGDARPTLVFFDWGNVYRDPSVWEAKTLRLSTGLALQWQSPMGPISISYAIPLQYERHDQVERLQFTFGGSF